MNKFTTTIRSEVLDFANEMELKLQKNDHKEHWRKLQLQVLFGMLVEEAKELENEIFACKYGGVLRRIKDKAVDVGNFAMMIWDVAGNTNK